MVLPTLVCQIHCNYEIRPAVVSFSSVQCLAAHMLIRHCQPYIMFLRACLFLHKKYI